MVANKAGVENGAAAGAGAAAAPAPGAAAVDAGFGALLGTVLPVTGLLEDDIGPQTWCGFSSADYIFSETGRCM